MATVTISPKFQVMIPKSIREGLHLVPGQKIQVLASGGRIELLPVRPISSMRGFLDGIDSAVERDEDRL